MPCNIGIIDIDYGNGNVIIDGYCDSDYGNYGVMVLWWRSNQHFLAGMATFA